MREGSTDNPSGRTEVAEAGAATMASDLCFGYRGRPRVRLEPSSAAEAALSNYRAQNADVEAQLFSRIRSLESQLSHGLPPPPQLNTGEYERLVRENLDTAMNVNHYHQVVHFLKSKSWS